jgi:peroxiredoxin
MPGRGAVLALLLAIVFLPACARASGGLSGTRAPDFVIKDLKGSYTSLAGLRGSVVLIHFWATWCTPCKDELTRLDALQRKYSGKGLRVLALSLDTSEEGIRDFLKKHPVSLTVIQDRGSRVAKLYRVMPIPVSFLIDRRGTVVKKYAGSVDWLSPGLSAVVEGLLGMGEQGSGLTPASREFPPFRFPRDK